MFQIFNINMIELEGNLFKLNPRVYPEVYFHL